MVTNVTSAKDEERIDNKVSGYGLNKWIFSASQSFTFFVQSKPFNTNKQTIFWFASSSCKSLGTDWRRCGGNARCGHDGDYLPSPAVCQLCCAHCPEGPPTPSSTPKSEDGARRRTRRTALKLHLSLSFKRAFEKPVPNSILFYSILLVSISRGLDQCGLVNESKQVLSFFKKILAFTETQVKAY